MTSATHSSVLGTENIAFALPSEAVALPAVAPNPASTVASKPVDTPAHVKADYTKRRQELQSYKIGQFAADLVVKPPLIEELLNLPDDDGRAPAVVPAAVSPSAVQESWSNKIRASVSSMSTEKPRPLGRKCINLALFGFTGAGKSAAVSILVNAVKNLDDIDLVADTGTGDLSHGTRNYCGFRLTRSIDVYDTRGLNFLDMTGDIREVFDFIEGNGCIGYVRRPGVDNLVVSELAKRGKLHAQTNQALAPTDSAIPAKESMANAAKGLTFSASELRLIERYAMNYQFDKTPGPLHAIALTLSCVSPTQIKMHSMKLAAVLQAINYHCFVLLVTQVDKLPQNTDLEKLRAQYALEFNLPPTKVFLLSSYTSPRAPRNLAAETEALRMVLQMLRLAERHCTKMGTLSTVRKAMMGAADIADSAMQAGAAAKERAADAVAAIGKHASGAAGSAVGGGNAFVWLAVLVLFLAVGYMLWLQNQQMAAFRRELLGGKGH